MPRPRKHSVGSTATDRVAVSTARLRASGGARKTFRLSAGAIQQLRRLKEEWSCTATAVIERLLDQTT
jgi:hypothetical protein